MKYFERDNPRALPINNIHNMATLPEQTNPQVQNDAGYRQTAQALRSQRQPETLALSPQYQEQLQPAQPAPAQTQPQDVPSQEVAEMQEAQPSAPAQPKIAPLSDEEAYALFSGIDMLKGDMRELALDELEEYSAYKASQGLQPFEPTADQKRANEEQLSHFMGGLDTALNAYSEQEREQAEYMMKVSGGTDGKDLLARWANIAYLENRRGIFKQDAVRNYEFYRYQEAQSLGYEDMSDQQLYFEFQKAYQREQVERDVMKQFIANAQRSAITGADALTAFTRAAEQFRSVDGWRDDLQDTYARTYVEAFENVAEQFADVRDLAETAYNVLRADRGLQEPREGDPQNLMELADMIVAIPEERRRDLLYAVTAFADNATDEEKGFFQQSGESLYRSFENVIAGHLRNFDQMKLSSLQSALKEGRPVYHNWASNTSTAERIQTLEGVFGAGTEMTGNLASHYWKLTESERGQLQASLNRNQALMDVVADLRDIAQGNVDPIEGSNFVTDKIWYPWLQNTAYTAQAFIPYAGIPLLYSSTVDMRAQEIRRENPEIDRADAYKIAMVSGIIETPIEFLQARILVGKTPFLGGMLKKGANGIGEITTRVAAHAGLNIIEVNTQEFLQDGSRYVVQEIASWGNDNVPGVNWSEALNELAGTRMDTFWATLPTALIGSGVATYRDSQLGAQQVSDATVLAAHNIPAETIDAIVLENNPQRRINMFKEAYQARTSKELNVDAVNEMQAVIDAVQAMNEDSNQPTIRALESGQFEVTFAVNDKRVVTNTFDQAVATAFDMAQSEGIIFSSILRNTMDIDASISTRVDAPKVIRSYEQAIRSLGVNLVARVGRLGRGRAARGSLGWFHPRTHVTRLRTANDIVTAGHEIGHAFEAWAFPKKIVSPQGVRPDIHSQVLADTGGNQATADTVVAELTSMGQSLYGKKEPHNGYASEGMAEFMAFYLAEPARLQQMAPATYQWFEQKAASNPRFESGLRRAQRNTQTWRRQGDIGRAEQSIVYSSAVRRTAQDLRARAKTFSQQYIDAGMPIFAAADQARAYEESQGRTITPSADAGKIFQAFRGTAASRVKQMVEDGMINLQGNLVPGERGRPLFDIRDIVAGRREEFTLYLWARHAKDWIADGRNPGITERQADTILREYGSREFEVAAARLYQWWDGVLDYVAESSPVFANIVERYRQDGYENYIPLRREFTELERLYKQGGQAGSGVLGSTLGKKATKEGSGRRVLDPISAMVAQAASFVDKAHERMVLDALVEVADTPGLGWMFEKIDRDMEANIYSWRQTFDALLKEVPERAVDDRGRLIDPQARLRQARDVVASSVPDIMDEAVTMWGVQRAPKTGEPIVPIMNSRTNKIDWYYVDPAMYEALNGLRIPDLSDFGTTMRIMAHTSAFFRLGTTGLRATFSVLTNPLRDIQEGFIKTQSGANPVMWLAANLNHYVRSAAYLATGRRYGATDAMKAFDRLGLGMSGRLSQDSRPVADVTRRMFQGRLVRTADPRNVYSFLRDFLQFPESAVRATEMQLIAKRRGYDFNNLTMDQAIELMIAAKLVSTDFTAAGTKGRTLNMLTPFWNAQLQGIRGAAIAFKRDPASFMLRGVALTGASIALWYQIKDEDWWKELSPEMKYLYTWIPIEIGGRKELLRIPRPFELGGLFMAMPMAIMDAWYQEDPEQASSMGLEFATNIGEGLIPLWGNPLVREPVQQVANYDFFFGRPIVPRRLENIDPEYQYSDATLRAAIYMGEKLGVSPMRVEHALRAFGGGAVVDVLSAAWGRGESGKWSDQFESELADIPIAGTLFNRGGTAIRSPEAVNELYEMERAAQRNANNPTKEETDQERTIRLMLQDATTATSAIYSVRARTQDRDERDKLSRLALSIAKQTQEKISSGKDLGQARAEIRRIMREWKRQKETLDRQR